MYNFFLGHDVMQTSNAMMVRDKNRNAAEILSKQHLMALLFPTATSPPPPHAFDEKCFLYEVEKNSFLMLNDKGREG